MTVLEKYQNARCCYGNLAYQFVQAKWKGEDTECLFYKCIQAYNALIAIERNLEFFIAAQSEFDLSGYTVTGDQTEIDVQSSDGEQLAYAPPAVYSTLNEIIGVIVSGINENGRFQATQNGTKIKIIASESADIGITATLTLSKPFDILNKQTTGGLDYSVETDVAHLNAFSTLNEADGLVWLTNTPTAVTTTVSLIDDTTEQDLLSFPTLIGQRGIVYHPSTDFVYIASANQLRWLDGDPNSGTYKTQLGTLLTGIVVMDMKVSVLNEQLYVMYAVASGTPFVLRMYDPANALVATMNLSNYISQSNFFNTITISDDFVYVAGYETSEVFVIDANPANPGTFNTVVNTLIIDHPRSIKYFDGFLYVVYTAYNGVNARLAKCDLSLNIQSEITIPFTTTGKGIDYIVINTYLYVQDTNTVKVYNVADLTLAYTLPNLAIGAFLLTPDDSLWMTQYGTNLVAIMRDASEIFSYDLDFDDTSTYDLTCLDKKQLDILFCQIDAVCPCSTGNTQGVFGDDTNIIGDGAGSAIDGNGNYIQV